MISQDVQNNLSGDEYLINDESSSSFDQVLMSDIEVNVDGEGNRVEEAKGQANHNPPIINFNGIKFFNNG